MELDQIYTEIITEDSRSKHSKRELENPTAMVKGMDPACGDEIPLQTREKDGIIEDTSFTGIGCATSQASASIMIDLIKGKTEEEAMHLAEAFPSMTKEGKLDEEAQDELEDAATFQNASKLPVRAKYAVLAWHMLKEVIQSDGNCPGGDPASCKTRI